MAAIRLVVAAAWMAAALAGGEGVERAMEAAEKALVAAIKFAVVAAWAAIATSGVV